MTKGGKERRTMQLVCSSSLIFRFTEPKVVSTCLYLIVSGTHLHEIVESLLNLCLICYLS